MGLSKGERTALALLDAAEGVFAEKGYLGASLREVAAIVGIQEPGIYRHFSGKDDLYQQVLARGLEPLSLAMAEKFSGELKPSNLASLPGDILALLAEHPNVAILLHQASQQNAENRPEAMNQWLDNLINQGTKLMRKAGYKISRREAGLRVINFFNLVTSYFVARQLIQDTCKQQALSKNMLEQQKQLLNSAAAAWLKPFAANKE